MALRQNKTLESLTLLSRRRSRAETPAFAALHVATLSFAAHHEWHWSGNVVVALGCIAHALVFLAARWSADVEMRTRYREVGELERATHVLVQPRPHRGGAAICELQHRAGHGASFLFRSRRFTCPADSGVEGGGSDGGGGELTFGKLKFPVKLTFGQYRGERGLSEVQSLEEVARYGRNDLSIPEPEFYALLEVQLTQPFFCFQVFCCFLWLFDEMWHYAVFTLLMLVVFESTVAMTNVNNQKQMQAMAVPGQEVHVWRGRWRNMDSTQLLPGDLFALQRSASGDTSVPCDGLLISGSCVTMEALLTGESNPQTKESIELADDEQRLDMKRSHDKVHVVFGGSRLLQVREAATDKRVGKMPSSSHEGACLVYALKTGFDTTQGKLMRTILFSNDRFTANNRESAYFILCLLCFAVVATYHVWTEGIKDEARDKWKLFLHCTLIMTSVVPPELPMELSLAVSNSLRRLHELQIWCTEPYRVPFAGKVDICAFDKTGTLTSEAFVVRGIAGLGERPFARGDALPPLLVSPKDAPVETAYVLAGCHSLTNLNDNVFGDPLEKTAVRAVGWEVASGGKSRSRKGGTSSSTCAKTFHFESALKRMGVVADLRGEMQGHHALVKGAPDVMRELFAEVPEDYDEVYEYFALKGERVLALGYKPLTGTKVTRAMTRDSVESDLVFAGFVVLTAPLKADTCSVIEQLLASSHRVTIITGDHILTACYVATAVGVVSKPALVLQCEPEEGLMWQTPDHETQLDFAVEELAELEEKYDLCMVGSAMDKMIEDGHSPQLFQLIKVFARTSPSQKEAIIATLNDAGCVTLMCGDGTNDVGALKKAHVGVGLMDPSSSGGGGRSQRRGQRRHRPEQQGVGVDGTLGALVEAENDGPVTVQLGDASIAAPFTTRSTSIKAVLDVIRQGRCTLVSMTQMYKILACNCLIGAYSLSVLYLDSLKFGEGQMMVVGLLSAGAFMFISLSMPVVRLAPQRPHTSIFRPAVCLSVILQSAVHLATLFCAVDMVKPLRTEKPAPDSEFKVDILNTSVFLLSNGMLFGAVFINYEGHPFMQGILQNRKLLYTVCAGAAAVLVSMSGISPDLNELLELVVLPTGGDFIFGLGCRDALMALAVGDFCIAWFCNAACAAVFPYDERHGTGSTRRVSTRDASSTSDE